MGYPHRIKPEGETWYHLYVSTVAKGGEYPLEADWIRQKLMQTIIFYANAYKLSLASHVIMGNHIHIVVRVESKRELSSDELMEHALRMYPRSRKKIEAWPESKWERFQERIFDVSEFMRNVLAHFGKWYNRMNNRKGRFWAERFKSTLLLSAESVRDCVMYVELNPVRAGLCERPEAYRWSSLYAREAKQDGHLLALSEILGERPRGILEAYKSMLYHRGAVKTKEGQKAICPEVLKREAARGFKRRGAYRKKLRYFTDGLALGGEILIREQLANLRETGRYRRRKHPVAHGEGMPFSLREQRDHFVGLT